MAKISKSYILTPPHPQGHVMSVKCEQPIDELTVQVWLLYHNLNFKYCTLFLSGTELRTDWQTNGQTDDPITRCPRRTFQAGGIKIYKFVTLPQLVLDILGAIFLHICINLQVLEIVVSIGLDSLILEAITTQISIFTNFFEIHLHKNYNVICMKFTTRNRVLEFFLKLTCHGQVKTENLLAHPRNLLSRWKLEEN